jgi:hypothetical protein
MKEFSVNKHADPASWKPAKLLARLAAAGLSFDDPLPRKRGEKKGKRRG